MWTLRSRTSIWKSLGPLVLPKQKQHLCELLDKNQLYVNLSSINDADFACTEEEKKITQDFTN